MPGVDDAVERAARAAAGALAGQAAHELSNRLAVMRETLGLLDDLACAGKGDAAATARAHASLERQVAQALNAVRALAGLGGALQAPAAAGVDAAALVETLLGLSERGAAQRSVRLESEFAAGLPRAAGEPAYFLCLADRLLRRQIEARGKGATVAVAIERCRGGLRVRVRGRGPRAGDAAPVGRGDCALERELARRLGAVLELEQDGGATLTLAALS